MDERRRTWAGAACAVGYAFLALQITSASGCGRPPPCLLLSLGAGALLVAIIFGRRPGMFLTALSGVAFVWMGGTENVLRGGNVLVLALYLAGCLAGIAAADQVGRRHRSMLERYRLLAESAFDGIILADDEGAVLWANKRAVEIFRRPPGELLESGLCGLLYPDDAVCLCRDLKQGSGVVRQCRVRTGERSHATVEISARRCSRGWLLLIVRDVTERLEADRRLRESLREKETLLKEIHHRVKNNLQIICSIFELKARRLRDPVTLDVFRHSLERVRAVALLHETLYRSRNLSSVNTQAYVEALVRHLASTYAGAEAVRLRVEVEDLELDLDTAMPCGLILSELLTNAFRHAFPDGRRGEVVVRLLREGGRVHLTVSDDGIGLPQLPQAHEGSSLGWQIVRALAGQLAAETRVDRRQGTSVTISFELRRSEGRPT